MAKHQIITIHGADTFDTYEEYLDFLREWKIDFEEYRSGKRGWRSNLAETLGPEYEIISPRMPCELNAKYLEWKIWFDKFVPHFEQNVVLIGHSMGGTFLAKYLSENKIPQKIAATFLVAPAYDAENLEDSMADFVLPSSLVGLEEQSGKIFIYFSEDDQIVPFANLAKFQEKLPKAQVRVFKDRGHFLQEQFPELVSDIKNLLS